MFLWFSAPLLSVIVRDCDLSIFNRATIDQDSYHLHKVEAWNLIQIFLNLMHEFSNPYENTLYHCLTVT